jgi:hypothetical protein
MKSLTASVVFVTKWITVVLASTFVVCGPTSAAAGACARTEARPGCTSSLSATGAFLERCSTQLRFDGEPGVPMRSRDLQRS